MHGMYSNNFCSWEHNTWNNPEIITTSCHLHIPTFLEAKTQNDGCTCQGKQAFTGKIKKAFQKFPLNDKNALDNSEAL